MLRQDATMRYVLNIIYGCLLIVLSPAIAYASIRHGKYRDGLTEKLFGLVPKLEPNTNRIWFHAVSVGEVSLLAKLVAGLNEQAPDVEIVISTTTKTGFDLAQQKYPDHIVFFCPLDFSWAVKNAFDRIQPSLFCLAELELWPNLLMEAGNRHVPVAIVNGRLSDASFRGYRRLGGLIKSWMSNVQLVTAQSEQCAERFVELGVDAGLVHAVGSLKFDGAQTNRDNEQTKRLRQLAGIGSSDVVFVAGSTQAPEEEIALHVYQDLVAKFPRLRLILVPRHPERFDEVARMLDKERVPFVRRSELNEKAPTARVLLVDTVGELGGWWGCADIGFVGGSMGSRGGQNMIEPSAYGVATCFGPNTKNFRAVVGQLIQNEAARVVDSEEELRAFVELCLSDSELRTALGERARRLVLSQRGATDKTIGLLLQLLGVRLLQHAETENSPVAGPFPQRRSA